MRTVVPIPIGTLTMDGISPDEIPDFVAQLNTIISWRMPKPKNERAINRKQLYSLDLAEAASPLLKIETVDQREVEVAVSYPPAIGEILHRFSLAGVAAKKPTPPPVFYITKDDQGLQPYFAQRVLCSSLTWQISNRTTGPTPSSSAARARRISGFR